MSGRIFQQDLNKVMFERVLFNDGVPSGIDRGGLVLINGKGFKLIKPRAEMNIADRILKQAVKVLGKRSFRIHVV